MSHTSFLSAAEGMSKIQPADVMRQAWTDYRRDVFMGWGVRRGEPFNRAHFGYCLRMAWAAAKSAAKPRPAAAVQPKPTLPPALVLRAAEIRSELEGMQYGDRIDWTAHRALSAELASISH